MTKRRWLSYYSSSNSHVLEISDQVLNQIRQLPQQEQPQEQHGDSSVSSSPQEQKQQLSGFQHGSMVIMDVVAVPINESSIPLKDIIMRE